MNFDQAIAARGINAKQAISNLKRRATYIRNSDRPKVWPSDRSAPPAWIVTGGKEALLVIQTTTNTGEYVSAWCLLNNLTN